MSQYEFGYAVKTVLQTSMSGIYGQTAMDMGMNGWFGDGNGYVGNIDLDPETAHTVSFSAAFEDLNKGLWEVKVTPISPMSKTYRC